MTFEEFINKCLMIEYVKGSPITEFGKPMDCYGFVWWYYKLLLGVELERNNVTSFDSIKMVEYEKVETPQDNDVVHIKSNIDNVSYHVGIYKGGYIYHFTYYGLVCKHCAKMTDKIKGYYRIAGGV